MPSDATLRNLVTPYLNADATRASCLSNFFPLVLTDSQSNTFLTGFLNRLTSNLSTTYNTNKQASSVAWSSFNINLVTAILEVAKLQMNDNFQSTQFWSHLLDNNWSAMISDLQLNYSSTSRVEYLHSSYLVEAATTVYNKSQSVNFLVDQSATVGASNFANMKAFLNSYVSMTNDDLSMMSIDYYDLNL